MRILSLIILVTLLLSGCKEQRVNLEPTFNDISVIGISGTLHQVRYRVDEENGEKLISPIFVYPDNQATEDWSVTFDHDKKYFFVRESSSERNNDKCPIVYLTPAGERICLGEDAKDILEGLRIDNKSVLEIVIPIVKDYLEGKAEPVAGGDATR